MTLAQQLSHDALRAVVARFKLREVGDPYLALTSRPEGAPGPVPIGACRVFAGDVVRKLVYVGISVPAIGLDSHMFFAFTAPDSPVPHFTLDSVSAGPSFAFHLDLIPRVDLGANLDYVNEAFVPLTPHFEAARKIDGLTPANLSPRQYALMSPWMLAFRATEAAYAQCAPHIDAYMRHWFGLVESGIRAPARETAEDLAARDRANRAAIFSYEVDPVWNQIERLTGRETNLRLIGVLRNQSVEELTA